MLFSELKAKVKSVLTEYSFQDFLSSYVVGMFEYIGVPVDKYGLRLLELMLLAEGKAALFWAEKFGRWITGSVTFTGSEMDEYGTLTDCTCFDRAGHEYKFKDWKNNEKCFIFFNDDSRNRDINIERYADLFSKIDISLNANIVNSRMSPIVVAKDNNASSQIKEILKSNHDGATEVITSPNILSELNGQEQLTVLNITDVNASDKIQYLSHAHDDLLRRFLNIYGLHISGTGKMAQQSVEEIKGTNNVALVIPYEMMKSRKETLKRFNEVTGIDCTIEFSKAWQREEREAESETLKLEGDAETSKEQAEALKEQAEERTEEAESKGSEGKEEENAED